MKKKSHLEFPGTKVYFTEADPSCQSAYAMNVNDFSAKLKLWLLLADHVILSTGHMIGSNLTFRWLGENCEDAAELSAKSALVSSLSDRYRTFGDFAAEQVPAAHSMEYSAAPCNPAESVRLLNAIFRESITWSAMDESKLFAKMMSNHLRDSLSPLRRRMIGVSRSTIDKMASEIEDANGFDRGALSRIAKAECPERQIIIRKYGDIFYYVSGALHKNAFPVMHEKASDLCRATVSYAAGGREETNSNVLWEKIIDEWGLSRGLLARLSLREIGHIREDKLGIRLRTTWAALLADAHEGKSYAERLSDLAEVQGSVERIFGAESTRQTIKHEKWRTARTVVEGLAWATGGLGFALGFLTSPIVSVASFATGVIGILTGPPIMGALEKIQKGVELVLLADRIRRISKHKAT